MSSSSAVVKSEDVLGQKWDKFMSDAVLKTGAGFAIGNIFFRTLRYFLSHLFEDKNEVYCTGAKKCTQKYL